MRYRRVRRYSDKPAMIVELKYGKSAKEAIGQIKDREYVKGVEGCEGKVLLVGVNYERETREYECLIEEWDKKDRVMWK